MHHRLLTTWERNFLFSFPFLPSCLSIFSSELSSPHSSQTQIPTQARQACLRPSPLKAPSQLRHCLRRAGPEWADLPGLQGRLETRNAVTSPRFYTSVTSSELKRPRGVLWCVTWHQHRTLQERHMQGGQNPQKEGACETGGETDISQASWSPASALV